MNATVVTLNLDQNDITDLGASALATALKANPNSRVAEINLSRNEICDDGALAFAGKRAMTRWCIDTLTDACTHSLATWRSTWVARAHTTPHRTTMLTSLCSYAGEYLPCCDAATVQRYGPTELLKVQTPLKTLNLSKNEISDTGGIALAAALKGNTQLTSLALDFNELGEEGKSAVAAALGEA